LPDICIGVDELQTPPVVLTVIYKYFKQFFNSININNPYSGTIIPSWFNGNDNVSSIMIEVNKNLYMDDNGNKNGDFERTQEILTGALDIIYEYET
jgi:N-formylglutamate amidohydrolase